MFVECSYNMWFAGVYNSYILPGSTDIIIHMIHMYPQLVIQNYRKIQISSALSYIIVVS